jgi:hypothetical protein
MGLGSRAANPGGPGGRLSLVACLPTKGVRGTQPNSAAPTRVSASPQATTEPKPHSAAAPHEGVSIFAVGRHGRRALSRTSGRRMSTLGGTPGGSTTHAGKTGRPTPRSTCAPTMRASPPRQIRRVPRSPQGSRQCRAQSRPTTQLPLPPYGRLRRVRDSEPPAHRRLTCSGSCPRA